MWRNRPEAGGKARHGRDRARIGDTVSGRSAPSIGDLERPARWPYRRCRLKRRARQRVRDQFDVGRVARGAAPDRGIQNAGHPLA